MTIESGAPSPSRYLPPVSQYDRRLLRGKLPAADSKPHKVTKQLAALIRDTMLLPEGSNPNLEVELRSYGEEFCFELIGMIQQEDRDIGIGVASLALVGRAEYFIKEVAFFVPNLPDVTTFVHGEGLVRSLRFHDIIGWQDDYSAADEKTQQKCLALLQTISALETYGAPFDGAIMYVSGVPTLRDSEFLDAVTDHPEDAVAIVSVIRQHGLTNYREIRAVLDGTPPALVSGAL